MSIYLWDRTLAGGFWCIRDKVNLLDKSEFFRRAQAEPVLRDRARIILEKQSRTAIDPSYEYPIYEQAQDYDDLIRTAISNRIDTSFIPVVLRAESTRRFDGYLFWYYADSKGYALQWSLVNLLFITIWSLVMLWKSLSFLMQLGKVKTLSAGALACSNTYILYHKPESLFFAYWIVPALVAGFALLIIWRLPRPQGQKKHPVESEAG